MNNINKDIHSLLELKDGWNFGTGSAISKQYILIALEIIKLIPPIYDFIEAYPLNNGSISLRVGLDKDNVIGLIIESENEVHAYYDNNINVIDKGLVQLIDIRTFINKEYKVYTNI